MRPIFLALGLVLLLHAAIIAPPADAIMMKSGLGAGCIPVGFTCIQMPPFVADLLNHALP